MTEAEKLRFLQIVGRLAANVGSVELHTQSMTFSNWEDVAQSISSLCEIQAELLSDLIDCVPAPFDDDEYGEQSDRPNFLGLHNGIN